MSLVAIPVVAAQETPPTVPPGASSSTTTTSTTVVANPSLPTTTTPPQSSTTTLPEASTTTVPTTSVPPADPGALPQVSIPPSLMGDPRAPVLLDPSPDDGGEVPVAQGVFDPTLNQVLVERVTEVAAQLEVTKRILGDLRTQLSAQQAVVEELTGRLDSMSDQVQRNVVAAAQAERQLKEHAIEAFITGSSKDKLALVHTSDPVQMGVAREMLGSVVESDEVVIDRYQVAKSSLTNEQQRLSTELETARNRLLDLERLISTTLADAAADAQALTAFETGSQLYVRGFVFPVSGEVEFIDSWGYPRMSGTSQAHWHQGTDIFAPRGTPLLAAESGVLDRIGSASLGGNKLWVNGDSGNTYYYAHLTAFAPGIHAGMRVNAGDVVGFVGDTGNARGTPPHLHFEVHPGGGSAVNPYPLLKATSGPRAMVQIVVAPPAGQPAVPAAAPMAVLVPPAEPATTTTTTLPAQGPVEVDSTIPGS